MVKDWKRVKIGELLDFKNGLNKGKDFFGSGTPIINYMDVYKKNGLHSADITGKVSLDEKEIKRYEVKKGDVFFTRTSETPEEVGIASVLLDDIDACVFSGFVLRGRPKTDMLLPEYCKYCFSTHEVRQKIIASCTYTTRALTNGTQLSKIEISVPDKDEQFRIVSSLTEVDQLIDKSEKLVKKYQDLKQACLQHMFPRAGQTEPDVRLPGFTGPWEQRKLGKITSKIGSGKTPSGGGKAYVKTGIPLIRSQNVHDDMIDFSDIVFINNEINKSMENSIVTINDVLLNITGASIGRSAVYKSTEPANVNQHVCIIRPVSRYCSDFIQLHISSERGQKQIELSQAGGAREGLNFQQIGKFKFFFPSYEEQVKIGEYFGKVNGSVTTNG